MRRKVLVVCMLDAVHAGRWLEQFVDEEIDFVLFPSSPNRRIHPKIRNLLESEQQAKFRLAPLVGSFGLFLWALDRIFQNKARGSILRILTSRWRPDFVHVLELTNAGYVALEAFWDPVKSRSFKLISTNWGSDIHWFSRFPNHRAKLKRLLSITDAYSCECGRDIKLAKDLGYAGEYLPVIPNAGGFSKELLSQPLLPSAERTTIAVKGYHGWAGRAKVAVLALAQMRGELEGIRVVIFSANLATVFFASRVLKRAGIDFEIYRKFMLSHEQVLGVFSESKVYIGLSVTDGISTSLLEAMAMGAIPVQTATACCDEWFSDTGVPIREITVEKVQEGIRAALELAKDQSNADRNLETIQLKASAEKVSSIARGFYQV